MFFKANSELNHWLTHYEICKLGSGSQGECYKIGNNVFKIFHQYIDEELDGVDIYSKDDILQFSSIVNNTYVFPTDVIMVGNIVVGYITDYIDAKSLYQINPLDIDLDRFQSSLENVIPDIKIISDNGVLSFDVMYNILYGNNGLNIIDTLDYSKNNKDSAELYKFNYERFIYEVRLFLIDGIFDKFVESDKFLNDMCYDKEVNFIDFLKLFRKKISENEGYEIFRLSDAKKSISFRKKRNSKYIRGFYQ